MRSVVLASYQGERYIGEQLDSILPQLAPGDEIVVSDDASTDNTLRVIAQREDSRIRVLANTARAGYVENFQRAIRHSHGDNIFFSDQDDVWLPNKIAVMDRALRGHACVASDAIVVDDRLNRLRPSYFAFRRVRSFTPMAMILRPPIIGATMACDHDYLTRLLPIPLGVPHDFWLSVNAAVDHAFGVVNSPLILYRRHAFVTSTSATGRSRPLGTVLGERIRLLGALTSRRFFGTKTTLSCG